MRTTPCGDVRSSASALTIPPQQFGEGGQAKGCSLLYPLIPVDYITYLVNDTPVGYTADP